MPRLSVRFVDDDRGRRLAIVADASPPAHRFVVLTDRAVSRKLTKTRADRLASSFPHARVIETGTHPRRH